MKIIYLAGSRIISDEANAVHVMKMCQAFGSLGCDVTLVCEKGADDGRDAFSYYGVSGFNLKRYSEATSALARWLFWCRKTIPGIRVGPLPSLAFGRAVIAELLQQHPPDLIYARHIVWLAAARPRIPFIVESHRPPANRLQLAIERSLYRSPHFRGLVVISSALADMYRQTLPELGDKIMVAHDAADPLPTDTRAMVFGPGFHVGYVGHLYKGRGLNIIRALADAIPEATFHCVGGTASDVEQFKTSGIPANIIVHGHQPPSHLAQYFAGFDAVLAPYQRKVAVKGGGDTSAFMSPLKLFEYMSAGKPILCSDLPVLHEILDQGRTALMLPPDQPQAWIDALRRLMVDAPLRQRLAANGKAQFDAHHSWHARAAAILDRMTGDL